jgi:peroxiredoxin Q/BCP
VLRDWKLLQIAARESFIVNPDGVIVKHYEDVDPDTHTDEVLAELERLIAGAG